MKIRKSLALIIACAAAVSVVGGCSGSEKNVGTGAISKVTTTDEYPIESNEKITYFCNMSDVAESMNETEFGKALVEQTGIRVEFQHPTAGSSSDSFNLMIASGEYPDIIENSWANFGLSKSISDGVAIPLNEVVEKVSPNFKKLLEEHSEIKRDITTNDGDIAMYPFYRGDDLLCTYVGAMVREDILDELGMELPETIDEWEAMLRAFKGKVEVPCYVDLTPSKMRGVDMFLGAYNVDSDLYVDNGKVKFGPCEDGFRQWVEKMIAWYNEGLIEKDFANIDSKRVTSLVVGGQMGAVMGYCGSNFGTWLPTLKEKNPEAKLVPVKYPVMNKGDRPQFGHKEPRVLGIGAVISTQCKNPEIAARLLDFGYSEKGHMLYNFGIEGESYKMKDNVPTYTSKILNSEEELSLPISKALELYTRVSASAPFVQDKGYITQYYRNETQREALKIWSDNAEEEHYLPLVQFTTEENQKQSKIMSDIRTYVDEAVLKMIMGVTPISEYDSFVSTIKSMGIDKAVEINQKAYDRYLSK